MTSGVARDDNAPVPSAFVAISLAPARRRLGPNLALFCVAVVIAAGGVVAAFDPPLRDALGALVRNAPLLLFVAVAVPVLLAIAQRPQRGVLLLAALVPFGGLLQIAPGKPPFAEGWKELLASYVVLWSFLATWRKPRVKHRFPTYVGAIGFYLLIGLISAIAVGGTQGLIGIKVGFFWVLIGVIVWRTPLDARDRDRLVSILMFDAVVTAAFGVLQQKLGDARLVSLGWDYNTNIRYTGSYIRSFSTFHNPFDFAFFLTFVLLLGIPVCLADPRRPRNQAFMVFTPLVLLGLAFSFVRGAWLALGVGLLYLAVRRFRVLLLPVPFAILALAVLPGTFSSSAFASGSLSERQLGWSQNLSKVVSAPLGNGIGTTGASKAKTVEVAHDVTAAVYQPDNQYFKVLYELGVLGLWAFGLMLIAALVSARRAEKLVAAAEAPLAMGITAHVLGAIVASFVATWLEIFPNDMYLWLMLAVIVTATHESS